jgi:hypothetical protein
MADLSKMAKKDLITMVEKLKAENQALIDERNQAEKHQADFDKVQQECSDLDVALTGELMKNIEVIEKREKHNAAVVKIRHSLEVSKLKDELKTLTDRLDAKRKSLENSGETISKYPARKARNTGTKKVVDSSTESESESSFEAHQNPNSLDTSDSDDDAIIRVPNAILQASRKKTTKQTATMHSFSASKAAKDASKTSTNNPNAKIPRSATPEKMLSFHTSFLKRASKSDLATMVEKQCLKLNGIGKEGTQRGKQSKHQLEKYKKDDLIKICQDQEQLVQEHTEKTGNSIDTFDVKFFEGAIEELKLPKYKIKKFFDTYERTYSVNVEDFINDLTILPKKKVKQQLHSALFTYYEMKSRGMYGEPTIHRSSYTKKMHEIVDYIFASEDEKSAEPIKFHW